jgi:hypothetical protein
MYNEFLSLPENIAQATQVYEAEKQKLSLAFAGREFGMFFRKLDFVSNQSEADVIYSKDTTYESLLHKLSHINEDVSEPVKLKIF